MRANNGKLDAVCGRVSAGGGVLTRCASLVSMGAVAGCWAAATSTGAGAGAGAAAGAGSATATGAGAGAGSAAAVTLTSVVFSSLFIGTLALLLLALIRVASSFGYANS